MRGKNNATGVGLVEAYDLNPAADSALVNISARGFVATDPNQMIDGFIVGPANAMSSKVLVRALGPSLSNSGITNPLQDPTLEMRNGNGVLITANDNWQDSQQAAIQATHAAPTNAKESAIVSTLAPGNYTAIVRGKNSGTGIAVVEVYSIP